MGYIFGILVIIAIPVGLAAAIVLAFSPGASSAATNVSALVGVLNRVWRFFTRGGESAMARVQRQITSEVLATFPRTRGGAICIPDRLVIGISPLDHRHIEGFEAIVTRELRDELRRHSTKFEIQFPRDLQIKIQVEVALPEGKVRVDGSVATVMAGGALPPTMPLPRGGAQLIFKNEVRQLNLELGNVTIGRSRACDVALTDEKASSIHCELAMRGTAVTVADLRSTNGTWLNGRRLTSKTEVKSGDKLLIGATEIEVIV